MGSQNTGEKSLRGQCPHNRLVRTHAHTLTTWGVLGRVTNYTSTLPQVLGQENLVFPPEKTESHLPEQSQSSLQVTLIPTHDSEVMREWYQETHEKQQDLNIMVLASSSTVVMQDESFPACKIEL